MMTESVDYSVALNYHVEIDPRQIETGVRFETLSILAEAYLASVSWLNGGLGGGAWRISFDGLTFS